MRKYLALAAVAMGIFAAQAQQTLTVNVTNLLPKGNLEIKLYNKKEGFPMKAKALAGAKIKVTGTSASYSFRNLPKGNYAVAMYQDENGNGKCDTNMIGYPKEGFGFSNNAKPKMAPPSFEDAKISIDRDKSISVKLIR